MLAPIRVVLIKLRILSFESKSCKILADSMTGSGVSASAWEVAMATAEGAGEVSQENAAARSSIAMTHFIWLVSVTSAEAVGVSLMTVTASSIILLKIPPRIAVCEEETHSVNSCV